MTTPTAAAVLALAISTCTNAFVHQPPSHAQTRLHMWNPFATTKESVTYDSQTKSLKDPNTMKMRELKDELESYGGVASTRGLFEKKELIKALEAARHEYFLDKLEGVTTVNESSGSYIQDQPTAASSPPTPDRNMATRYDKIQAEMERCKKMKTADLRKELDQYGLNSKGMFEKRDFVRAVAEARVDGMKKQYKKSSSTRNSSTGFGRRYDPKEKGAAEEPFDPTYRDVVTRKLEDDVKAGLFLSDSVIDVNARSDFQ